MRLIKCDKCGKDIPHKGYDDIKGTRWYGITFEKYHELESTIRYSNDEKRFDLCRKCYEEWLNECIKNEEE